MLAQIQERANDFPGAEETLRAAISEFPWYHDLKTTYANFLVNRGRMKEANAVFEEVSEEAPGDIDVIILRGTMALRESRIDEAYENAMWALNEDATDPAAVQLLAQVKMRRNPILGLGWRYAAWISKFTNRQIIMIIIGIWLIWQVVFRGLLKQLPAPIPVMSALAWFAFCVLTWVSPLILKHMVKKELESVRIRDF